MASKDIEIKLSSGEMMPAYFAKAQGTAPAPSVVILQEIFGVNANIRAIADNYAERNFNAIAPDLYWREKAGVQLSAKNPDEVKQAMELMKGMDQDLAAEDAVAAGNYARQLEGANGKLGAVGYCIGGKIAYLVATKPGIDAAVSYYGIAIYGALDKASEIKCPLLLHIPEDDHLCPPEAQAEIKQALGKRSGVKIMTYPGVDHAFARRGGDAYNADATNRADAATLTLFADALSVPQ
ncbi:dienelactone hydrolase family protein [Terriglobus sp.]|uniref:dienelactone hydrolase family protein n=1 Tax=Terriglobus sp. TaxID=1889013 RepID=UPI003AFFB297